MATTMLINETSRTVNAWVCVCKLKLRYIKLKIVGRIYSFGMNEKETDRRRERERERWLRVNSTKFPFQSDKRCKKAFDFIVRLYLYLYDSQQSERMGERERERVHSFNFISYKCFFLFFFLLPLFHFLLTVSFQWNAMRSKIKIKTIAIAWTHIYRRF